MTRLLHVTNGDSAALTLAEAGLGGEIIVWRDVLHEGPVPADLQADALREVRASFIAAGWSGVGADAAAVLADFAARDAALARADEADEIVLWFEHDLYDQLQLLQVLDRLASMTLTRARASLIVTSQYLGAMAATEFPAHFARRQPVTPGQLSLARRAWAAFRSAEPTAIERLLTDGTSELPFLAAALIRLLEQYPAVRTGLSRSEAQALRAIAAGHSRLGDAFMRANEAEEALFLGDTTFALYLGELARPPRPLLRAEEGAALTMPRAPDEALGFWSRRVSLTADGRDVIEGRADRIALQGIDRWIGGAHLTTDRCWRWDEARGVLVSPVGGAATR